MFTYQFKLLTPKETISLLWEHANKLNLLYNYFLDQKISNYNDHKLNPSTKLISKFDQIKEIKTLKTSAEFQKLTEIHSQTVQSVPDRLDKAYKAFFNRVKNKAAPGFPKFRSCHKFFGILYPQSGYKIKDDVFSTKIYGELKFIKNRDILGNIKQVYISNKNNKFYINIITDHSYDISNRNENTLAIDLGIKCLVVGKTNTGRIIKIKDRKQHAAFYSKKIGKLQSKRGNLPVNIVDGRIKVSRTYKRISGKIQKLYEMKSRKITDFHHKVSSSLSHQFDTIFVENLSVKDMSESDITSLNRNMREARLGQFMTFLEYKTYRLIKVNPYNTSRTCNKCGNIKKDLKLTDRKITCEKCGHRYDRDENAAENIDCLGQAILQAQKEPEGSETDLTLEKVIKKLRTVETPALRQG
jgi:putative transposase